MRKESLISVVMGIRYQRTDLTPLSQAIDSILGQTYSNFELLICESQSLSDVKKYLHEKALQDTRIHLVNGTGAESLASKLNRCIVASKGEWIARMDDDDISEPDRLKKQLEYLESHPMMAFAGCNVSIIQGKEIIGIRRLPQFPQVRDFLFVQPFIHPTLMFRSEVLNQLGGYCESPYCDGCEDYELLLRLYEAGYFGVNLQESSLRYRIPEKGKSNRTFHMRINEARTRWIRFRSLKLLPQAIPFVIKPILVGMIPARLLNFIKAEIYSLLN